MAKNIRWLVGAAVALLCAVLWTPTVPRAELERRYLASPQDLFQVSGQLVHVRDTGPRDARALLLIHGLGAHLQTWDGWAALLERDYRVVRLDLPGHGLSPPDVESDYTDARTARLLLALLDRLGLERAALLGNSIGGRIAWKFAAAHPERVTQLVLVAPDGYASPGFDYGKPAAVPGYLNVIEYVLPAPMLRANIEVAYSNPERLTDTVFRRYYDLLRAPGARRALLERMRQTVQVPPEPLLAEIDVPVLLLWGANDQMIPATHAAEYANVLPNSRTEVLPNLGHLPHEENPAASVAPVQAFLQEIRSAQR